MNWANGIPDLFFSQQKRQLIEAIQEVSGQSDTMLPKAFEEIRRKIDEALDAIGQLLDPNRNLATANGAPTPSGADNLQPPPNEPLRIQSGSGGMGSAPNPAVVSQLAADLGIPPNQIAQAVQVLSQERVRQLHSELGQELFESLLKRTPIVIEKFSQALELIGTDAVARRSLIEILPPSKVLVPSKNLEQAVSEIAAFFQKYQGRASGDFPARFGRKFRNADPISAAGELRFGEDFLGHRYSIRS